MWGMVALTVNMIRSSTDERLQLFVDSLEDYLKHG